MGLKKRTKVSADFSMASMTDMIFLLLIFFMLTSTLVTQNALNLKLPSSSSQVVLPKSMGIAIEPGGKFYLDGTRMEFEQIEAEVNKRVSKSSNPANTTITIFTDQTTEIGHVARVMDLALRLKVSAVLATNPPES